MAEPVHLFCGYWGFPHSATLLFLILALLPSFPFLVLPAGSSSRGTRKGLEFALLAVSWCVPSPLHSVVAEDCAGVGPSRMDGCSWRLCAQGRHGRGKGLKRAGQKLAPMQLILPCHREDFLLVCKLFWGQLQK